MNRIKLYKVLNITLPFLTVALVAAIYSIVCKVKNFEMLVPSIPSVFREFFVLFGKEEFYKAVGITLLRAAVAYLISATVAALVATLTKLFSPIKSALYPLILLIRVLPTMSLILLLTVWYVDDSNVSTVSVAFCIVFPMLYTSFCDAADGVDKDLVEMSEIYGVDLRTRAVKLYIPQMLPAIFTGIKSTAGLNLKLIIAAEVLAQAPNSIGVNMQNAKINLDTAELLAWTAVAVILGAIIEAAIVLIEKKAVKGR